MLRQTAENMEFETFRKRSFSRIDTLDLKSQIMKKFGLQKAREYFLNLKRFLNQKLDKVKFNKFCYSLGKENIRLHNCFIRSILSNACCYSLGLPSQQEAKDVSRKANASSGCFGFLLSSRNVKPITGRRRRNRVGSSPLGPNGKVHSPNAIEVPPCDKKRLSEQQIAPELMPDSMIRFRNELEVPKKRLREQQSAIELIPNGTRKTLLELPSAEQVIDMVHNSRSPLRASGKLHFGNIIQIPNSFDNKRSKEMNISPGSISNETRIAWLVVASLEDGKDSEQLRDISSVPRSPITAPLGIGINFGYVEHQARHTGYKAAFDSANLDSPDCCRTSSMLPDSLSLKNRLENKLETEGLSVSDDYLNLLSHGLNSYLKGMIKPCMELAHSRRPHRSSSSVHDKYQPQMNVLRHEEDEVQGSNQSCSASLLDFQSAMQSDPRLLGIDWPLQLEKISSCYN